MEEASPFACVVQTDELVQPVVIFRDCDIRDTRLGDDRQLVVRVSPNPVVADLQDAEPLAVIAVPSQDVRILADLAELVPDVVEELGSDAILGFRERVAIWVNGNKVLVPKRPERT